MWRPDQCGREFLYRQAFSCRLVLLLLLGLGLAACGVTRGQLDAVGAFGKSANKLADGIKDAYAQADKDEVQLRLAREIVSLHHSDPKEILEDFKKRRFDLSTDKIKGRLAAAEALSAYGAALASLLDSKTQDSDFSTAATSLEGAIKGLPASFLKEAGITGSDIDGIGAVVVALGKIALDVRRREVLEEVVPAAEPAVTKICKLFERDFNIHAGDAGDIVNAEMADVLNQIRRVFREDPPPTHSGPPRVEDRRRPGDSGATMQNRAILIPMYENVGSMRIRTLTTFGSLKAAANSCATASAKLAKAVEDPDVALDDIIDFVKKAQAAYNAVENLSNSNK